MLAFMFVTLAIITGYIQGGRINKTIHVELRHSYIIWSALLLQVAMLFIGPVLGDVLAAYAIVGHFAAYIMVVTFLLLNWNIRGLQVIAAGLICNLFAIVAASSSSTVSAAIASEAVRGGFTQIVALFSAKPLWFLGDIFTMPSMLSGDTFSIGDVLVGIGLYLGSRQVLFTWPASSRFQIKSRYQPKHLNRPSDTADQVELTDIAS
jgi:hypothetical protein